LDEQSIQEAKKQKRNLVGPRKKRKEEGKNKGDIQSMIRNMPCKKSTSATIKDDDILGELLSEISANKETTDCPKSETRNKFCHTVHSDIM